MGPPQVGGGIGPLGLVDSWIGYRVFKKKKKKIFDFGLNLLDASLLVPENRFIGDW